MARTRKSRQQQPACSVQDLLDKAVEQTVRQFVKNLVCGAWKDVFDKYEDIPIDSDDDEDYTEYDEENPEQREKISVYLEHIDKAMMLWNVMVHKRNGLSYLNSVPKMPTKKKNTNDDASHPTTTTKHSPYIVFCKDERPKIKEEMPTLKFGDIAKELGRRWRALSPEDKREYMVAPTPPPPPPPTPPHEDAVDDDENDEEEEMPMPSSTIRISDLSVAPETNDETMMSQNLLYDYEDEEEEDEPLPDLTTTQTDRPEPREMTITKDYYGILMKDMSTDEKKAFKRYKGLPYDVLLQELDYNNILIVESTPPRPQKQREIINALMNVTFFPMA